MAIQSWILEEVASGFIRSFYGLRANIPSGWQECDGTNGTPDLRGLYSKGAGAGQEANETGGALTHTHGAHATASNLRTGGSSAGFASAPDAGHDSPNHEPPFKTTIWIMKL